MSNDVEIIITRETSAVTQAGFGMPLILGTTNEQAYKEYTDLEEVAEDFDVSDKEYVMANRILGQSPRPEKLAIYGVNYDPDVDSPTDLVEALNTLMQQEGDWYFLLCTEDGDDEVNALSAWVDAQDKLYFVTTQNMSLVETLEGDKTAVMYHDDENSHAAAGWVGRCAPELPGSITWKFKTINGISAADITSNELSTLHENGGNSYVRKMGVLQSSEGLTTSGEYIDVIRSEHFVKSRMAENIGFLLSNTNKIPFDNRGISLVVAEIEKTLKQAFDQGIIAADEDGNPIYTVSAPDRADVSPNDRANRILPDVHFSFELAGAIHSVRIRGVIQV